MKKIFSIMLLASGLAAFTACSDDTENPYEHVNTISVVKQNLDFTAREGTGSLVFASTTGNVTVKSNADWCTATVNADSVVVNVAQNNTLNGRSTTLILNNGTDTLQVAITQRGVVAQLAVKGIAVETDDAFKGDYKITTNVNLSVYKAPDWVTASVADGNLHVETTANTTGAFREGYICYNSGDFRDSVKVYQADFNKDIAGTYNLDYTTSKGQQKTLKNVVVSKTGIKLTNAWTMPVTFDPVNGDFVVTSGSYIGKSGASFIYLAYGLADNLWTSYNAGIEMKAKLSLNEDGSYTAPFAGKVNDYDIQSWMFRKFSKQAMTDANDTGNSQQTWFSPVLRRDAPTSDANTYILR